MSHCNRIEQTIPVDKWKFDGIHVWPFLRTQMGSAIRSQINSRDSNRLTDTGNGFVRIYLNFFRTFF